MVIREDRKQDREGFALAGLVELVYTADLKSADRKVLRVRVPHPVPIKKKGIHMARKGMIHMQVWKISNGYMISYGPETWFFATKEELIEHFRDVVEDV